MLVGSPSQSKAAPGRSRRRVGVIGGGIAGLSAALTLQEAGCRVTVIEASQRLGGKIRTDHVDGFVIEAGPDSILSYKPAGLSLMKRLGILDRVVNTREDGQGTFILHRGKLQPLPEGMTALVPVNIRSVAATKLLSPAGKLRLALEYFLPARREKTDESVGSFVRRRLGDDFYRNLAEPLLSGIYAGDADQLSLHATFPRLRQTERQHGGMIRGALAGRRRETPAASNAPTWSTFISLEGGLADIIAGIQTALAGADIRKGTRAASLHSDGTGYQIELDTGEALDVDALVLATPAWATAGFVRAIAPALASELHGIEYVSTATVSLAYNAEDSRDKVGRGFVIPRSERRLLTAVTWSSSKFANRAPQQSALVRGYVGRANDQESLNQSDEDLVIAVRQELAELAGIDSEPLFTRVYRWPRALPQYNLGHPERVARIEALTAELQGLALTGAGYRGVGIPDCIDDGIRQANRIIDHLQTLVA